MILPGTGRGTMRSMVEGVGHLRSHLTQPLAPSTTPDQVRGGPPPRAGEDL